MTEQQLFDYNKKKGIQNYVGPFTKLFCVYLNHAPTMDYYYLDNSVLTSEEIDEVTGDTTKQGFSKTLFASDSRVSSQ